VLKSKVFPYHLACEIFVWFFYVVLYKYSYFVDQTHLPANPKQNFPNPELCLFSIMSSLFFVPYYRWAIPKLLNQKKYGIIILLTVIWFVMLSRFNYMACMWLFSLITEHRPTHAFFLWGSGNYFFDLNLILTDTMAFLSLAFSHYSYNNETVRRQVEKDHLYLQLSTLKAQLQPHFLLNNLNSLYSISLSKPEQTPGFILLLSQMMQYILYECEQERVEIADETDFLKTLFELEQQKFPKADIRLQIPPHLPLIRIPPLLVLPLVENSFKHGKHRVQDNAVIRAALIITDNQLSFEIENDQLENDYSSGPSIKGGIGLVNLQKRLNMYFPEKNTLKITQKGKRYNAHLTIDL
jgi:sensor histidine kinase YesM